MPCQDSVQAADGGGGGSAKKESSQTAVPALAKSYVAPATNSEPEGRLPGKTSAATKRKGGAQGVWTAKR